MKKQFLILFVLATTGALAQVGVPQGSAILGGCVGFKSKTTEVTLPNVDDIKESSYNIELQGLFGLNQNWYVGGALGYEGEKETQTNQENLQSLFTIGPKLRYQYSFIERANCFAEMGLLYGSGKIEQTSTQINPITNAPEDFTITDKFSRISVNLSPGIAWRMKPKWEFDVRFGGIGYTSTTYKPDDIIPSAEDYSESKFRLHLNTDHIMIGMKYILNGSY